jgi:hypothetical protein
MWFVIVITLSLIYCINTRWLQISRLFWGTENFCWKHMWEIFLTIRQSSNVKVFFPPYIHVRGAHSVVVAWGTALQAGRSQVRFPMVLLEFFIDIILLAALCQLSLQQEWVPGIFRGVKGGRCVELTILPPSCASCLEIWESQPPGTLRACPGL